MLRSFAADRSVLDAVKLSDSEIHSALPVKFASRKRTSFDKKAEDCGVTFCKLSADCLPKCDTCVYVPSFFGLPSSTYCTVAASDD